MNANDAASAVGKTPDVSDTPDTSDEPIEQLIDLDLVARYDARAITRLALRSSESKVYGRVACIATVLGLLATLPVFGLSGQVLLWTLVIVILALVMAAVLLGRRRDRILPRLVEGHGNDDLIRLYEQIRALYTGSVIGDVDETVLLQQIQDVATEWRNALIVDLDNLVRSQRVDSETAVSQFDVMFARLIHMAKAAPSFVPEPIFPESFDPWITAAGYEWGLTARA